MFSDFFSHVILYALVFLAIILLIVFIPVFKRRKAARIVAEQRRVQQEEARRRAEQEKLEEEKRKKESQQKNAIILSEIESAIASCPSSRQYYLDKYQYESSVSKLNITEFTPISKKRYVAFDLETTGLNPGYDSIVEIGAVRVENGVVSEEYHQMVNPGIPMPSDASAVNHITDDMLSGKPKIHQVLPSFLSFVGDDILAAHNATFDIKFISQACMRYRFRVPSSCFDTMALARYWPESDSKKLSSLCSAAGIKIDDAHRALSDARAVADLISATNKRRSEKKKTKEAP